MRKAGLLHGISRYPVKSMGGEELSRAIITDGGIHGDRVYQFVDPDKSGRASWVTARKAGGMVLYSAHVVSIPYNIEVMTPSGRRWNAESQELAAEVSELYGKPVEVVSTPFGAHDQGPISIISMQTIRALSKEMSKEAGARVELDPRRFRANLYVNWERGGAFFEDTLVGKTIRIGASEFRIVERDPRCVMISIDPETAERDNLYKMVHRNHGRHVGVYAEVLRDGLIMNHDSVYVI